MNLKKTLEDNPAKIYFIVSAAILILSGILFFYDKYFGKSYTDQSELEQVVRLLIGSLLTMTPGLVVMAVVYWLMFKFKRPTHPKLNVFHFNIWIVTVLLMVVSGSLYLIFRGIINENQYYILESIMVVFGASLYLIFIGNVVGSLGKKNFGREDLSSSRN